VSPVRDARRDPPPDRFVTVAIAGDMWRVRAADAADLERSDAARLLEGPGVREGAPGQGRSRLARLRVGSRDAVGKRALHGGLLGGLLGGHFLGSARVERTLDAAERLRSAGVPTAAVIAAGWRRTIGPLRAHALLTEAIAGGVSLQDSLLVPGLGRGRRRALLHAAGRSVRAMHAAGFRHADLNLANLVVAPAADGPFVHVVDLDGGRFEAPLGTRSAGRNLARLLRSWEKWVEPHVQGGLADLVAFLRGYSPVAAERRRLAEDLLRRRSGLWARRWLWDWRRATARRA
jgi:tRNA A-37 threonylcarbamoyl transferase component Bud32